LYVLGEKCGGNFTYLPNGVKDCSACMVPHVKDKGYEHVVTKMPEVIKMVKHLRDENEITE
jgi:Zn-finger protein